MVDFNNFFSYVIIFLNQLTFFFQETYNTWLQERYRDNHSTYSELDLDLWLEVGLSGEPDKNQVYGISHTTVEELQTTQNVSTVGCSQSTPSTQSPEFHVILNNKLYLRRPIMLLRQNDLMLRLSNSKDYTWS